MLFILLNIELNIFILYLDSLCSMLTRYWSHQVWTKLSEDLFMKLKVVNLKSNITSNLLTSSTRIFLFQSFRKLVPNLQSNVPERQKWESKEESKSSSKLCNKTHKVIHQLFRFFYHFIVCHQNSESLTTFFKWLKHMYYVSL